MKIPPINLYSIQEVRALMLLIALQDIKEQQDKEQEDD